MRITFLLENAEQLWGGVKVALEDANWLHDRGHQVTVVSRSGPPAWLPLRCGFQQVHDFNAHNLPDADALIGTFWITAPWVADAGPEKGVKVHFCQGYEGDTAENQHVRDRIEATYRLPGMNYVTISPHLTELLRERFGTTAHEVRYVIDHDVHKPAPPRKPGSPLRVGLVGPYQVSWKDLPTGYAACELAHKAGQELVLVRATNVPPYEPEQNTPFPVEWHRELRPDQMGDYYRSLDVFLATSSGPQEGFFLPAIEAMACGVPTVLTDVPCFRSHERLVGHDRYGLFVEPRDPAAMAEAMVLAGALPDVRAGLRAGGIELAGHYHADLHGQQFEQVLQELVDEAAPPQPERVGMQLIPNETPAPTGGDSDEPVLERFAGELRKASAEQRQRGHHDVAARLASAAQCLATDQPTTRDDLRTAQQMMASGRHAPALSLFDRLLHSGRDDEALHSGRGHCLQALGRMDEAVQAFRAALAVGARTADNYNRLGIALLRTGNVFEARISFESALALDPGHADARANLQGLPAA